MTRIATALGCVILAAAPVGLFILLVTLFGGTVPGWLVAGVIALAALVGLASPPRRHPR